ncbi:MAG: hypothetical protein ACPGQR_07665 [Marinirhabdus sp.]
MLYHSKKPTTHYKLPDNFLFVEGGFEVFSIKGEKKMVAKETVLPYKISNTEAFSILSGTLKGQFQNLKKGLENMAEKASPPTEKNKKGQNNRTEKTEEFSEKIKSGVEFLKLSTKTMGVFWKIANTDNFDELETLKNEMKQLKKSFTDLGYPPNDDFVETPFNLKEKYAAEGKLDGFHEAATAFKKTLHNLKKGWKDPKI